MGSPDAGKETPRATARRPGKTVRFEVSGKDIHLDKTVTEPIYDPIAHQIRNAIVHGPEHADQRERAGKDRLGRFDFLSSRPSNEPGFKSRMTGPGSTSKRSIAFSAY